MSDKTPFSVNDADILNNLMTMRESTRMVIEFKKTHPVLHAGNNELWLKDINDMAKMVADYDMLIRKLIEINIKQGEMIDKMADRMEQVLKGSA